MPRFPLALAPALALSGALLTASCGSGGGTETALPGGPQTSAPPSNKVIYASLSQGDAVVAYRLGSDGFLPGDPFSAIPVREPRQVLVVGSILYIATEEGVASLQLGADGSLPRSATSVTAPVKNADASRMIVHDNTLYVTMERINRIYAYPLVRGHVAAYPISSSGSSSTNYVPMVRVQNRIYAGARNAARIDYYLIFSDGSLNPSPELQDPEARIFDCKDLLEHNGILYAIEQDERRLVTFTIRENGLLPYKRDSKTAGQNAYAYLTLDGEDRLYASAFNEGRIDLFIIPPGGLFEKKQKSVAHTWSDTASFPTQMLIDNGILYVSQMGIGRIDGYVLGADGAPSEFPATSAFAIKDSYLNSITMGVFPSP
jgi:hypothetical protein